MKNSINIAILGLGNIGTEFVNALNLQTNSIENSFGYKINIKKILISNKAKKRTANIDANIITTDPHEIFEDESINVVVELMGGTDPSFSYVIQAIKSNKSIITANKDLIASHGKEIFELAKANNVSVFFEAAVASGTPIISTLIRDLSAANIQSIRAIINGTSNFILTEMDENKMEFNTALDLAKELVYSQGIDLENRQLQTPIGVSCRICPRVDCQQRAFPPLHKKFDIDLNKRGISVYVAD